MSIYSANRTGSMNTVGDAYVNEGYQPVDLARMLYESEVNDMMVFEAIMASDFNEIRGLREGTILESEIEAMNEASRKELMASLRAQIEKFRQRIAEAFKAAITKISAYILRDGQAFAKNFRAVYANRKSDLDMSIEIMMRTDYTPNIPNAEEVEAATRAGMGGTETPASIAAKFFSKDVGTQVNTARDYNKAAMHKAFEPKKVTEGDIDKMLNVVGNASSTIKGLRAAEKTTNEQLKKISKLLQIAEREAESAAKKAGGLDDRSKVITNITDYISAYKNIIATTTSTTIKITKHAVSEYRKGLSKVLSDVKHEGAIMAESAAMVAEDEVFAALDDTPGQTISVDDETQKAIDNVIATADAELG